MHGSGRPLPCSSASAVYLLFIRMSTTELRSTPLPCWITDASTRSTWSRGKPIEHRSLTICCVDICCGPSRCAAPAACDGGAGGAAGALYLTADGSFSLRHGDPISFDTCDVPRISHAACHMCAYRARNYHMPAEKRNAATGHEHECQAS